MITRARGGTGLAQSLSHHGGLPQQLQGKQARVPPSSWRRRAAPTNPDQMPGPLLLLYALSAPRDGLPVGDATCDQVLATDCDGARCQGLFACGSCIGANQLRL
jgi:hypothetical protein